MSETKVEVDEQQAGGTVAAVVREALSCPWSRAKALVKSGRVDVDGARRLDPASRVERGSTVVVRPEAPKLKKGVLSPDRVLHLDADVIVVRKPAATLTLPWDASDKDTLADQVGALLKRKAGRARKGRGRRDPMVGVVQRLDKDTTGALVFARNMTAKRSLEQQLREHTVHREYRAIVHGALERETTYRSDLLQDRGDGLRGSWGVFRRATGRPPGEAKRSVTHARPLEALRGATLIACRLETGRQHQIRIHLAEAGHMLVGERVYLREHRGPKIAAPRPMLHAAKLGFEHPRTGERVTFQDPLPEDFESLLAKLRLS